MITLSSRPVSARTCPRARRRRSWRRIRSFRQAGRSSLLARSSCFSRFALRPARAFGFGARHPCSCRCLHAPSPARKVAQHPRFVTTRQEGCTPPPVAPTRAPPQESLEPLREWRQKQACYDDYDDEGGTARDGRGDTQEFDVGAIQAANAEGGATVGKTCVMRHAPGGCAFVATSAR